MSKLLAGLNPATGLAVPVQVDANGILQTTGGSGGGGGSSDPAVAAGIGAPADSAYSGTGSGSVIAILKAVRSLLAGTLTATINGMLPAGTNTIGSVNVNGTQTVAQILAAPLTGQVKIVTTNTAVQLPSAALTNGIAISAKSTNAAQTSTYSSTVGGSAVTTAIDGTGNGYPLAPGGSISFSSPNANQFYVNGTAGDVFFYAGS